MFFRRQLGILCHESQGAIWPNEDMRMDTTKLFEEALKLPAAARAALAGSLIDSLDEVVDEDAEAAWAVEISHRLQELDSGAVRAVPWAEARRWIVGA